MKNQFLYHVMLFAALAMPLTAGVYDFPAFGTAAPADSWILMADEDPSSTTDSFCCSIVGFEAASITLNSVALRWAYNTAYGYNHNGVTITLHDNTDGGITHNDQTRFVTGTHCFFTGLLSGHSYTATARTICGNDTSHTVSVSFLAPVCGTVLDGTTLLYSTPMYASQPVVDIHPNPSSTYVSISGTDGTNLLSVIDISGRTLYTQTIDLPNNQPITLDVSNFAPGTYFVRLTGPRQTVVGKLVVK